MLHQVYVNGRYSGTTIDSCQREIIVSMPECTEEPVRIEVFAVGPEEADTDFSDEFTGGAGIGSRVKISVLRGQELPAEGTFQFYGNDGDGAIDYGKAISERPLVVWAAWQDKAGWGMSRFGASDFGFDWSAAVGHGRGSFGTGQSGADADIFEWMSSSLEAGEYEFGVKVSDEAGNESNAGETGPVTVIPAARAATELSIGSFDKQTNQLILKIADSN
jgi:hypothetical protein